MASSTKSAGVRTHRIQSNLDGLENIFTFLVAVPEALEDQNVRIAGLEERVGEGSETVDDLTRAYESLTANLQEAESELDAQKAEVEALREEIEELRDDLHALRGLFSGRVLEKEDAHIGAQKRDASEIVEVGDMRTIVIDGTDYEDSRDPNAVAHIEGLVTFIPAPAKDLAEGDEVEVRIADVGDSHANAVRIEG